MKNFFWNLIACGLPHDHDLEELRRVIMLNLITLLGTVFLLPLCILSIVQGHHFLVLSDGSMLVLLIALLVYFRKTLKIEPVALFGTIMVGAFFLLIFANGGMNRTTHLWVNTFPLVAFFLLGHNRGFIISMLFLGLISVTINLGYFVPSIVMYEPPLIIRILMAYTLVMAFAYVMERVRYIFQQRLTRANRALEDKINEIETLRGILPICASCKKIRDDKGYWHQVETYIHDRSMADFTHGICPECKEKLYPELYKKAASAV